MKKTIEDMELQQRYDWNAARYRGMYIRMVIDIENILNQIIAFHITPDRKLHPELLGTVIATKHLTYDGKCEIVKTIIKKRNIKTSITLHKIGEEFRTVGKRRNIFAHYQIHTTPEILEKFQNDKVAFSLIQFENKETSVDIDKQKMLDFISHISSLIDILKEVVTVLVKK